MSNPEITKDLISIVVPVYNGQDVVKRCLDSIDIASGKLDGTKVEIIVIDDGSRDDTPNILKEACSKDDRIRVIDLPDLGVSSARNRGLEASRGEYITFIDADDVIDPDMLMILYESIQKDDLAFVGCRFYEFSDDDRLLEKPHKEDVPTRIKTGLDEHKDRSDRSIKTFTPDEYIEKEILNGNSRCWSKLYRKDAIANVRFKDGLSIGEDMLFVTKVASRIKRSGMKIAELTDYKGYGYYKNDKGAMNRVFTPSYMDQITCWEMMKDELKSSSDTVKDLVNKNILVGIMLTASKIALLSSKERYFLSIFTDKCKAKLKEHFNMRSYRLLDRGYRFKVRLFLISPALYMWLYHFRKYK